MEGCPGAPLSRVNARGVRYGVTRAVNGVFRHAKLRSKAAPAMADRGSFHHDEGFRCHKCMVTPTHLVTAGFQVLTLVSA